MQKRPSFDDFKYSIISTIYGCLAWEEDLQRAIWKAENMRIHNGEEMKVVDREGTVYFLKIKVGLDDIMWREG